MSRKFRELIPLFAIALMIIGAVALLIAMNSKGKTKKIVTKEDKTEIVKDEVKEEKEETEKEVAEPVAEIDVTEKDVTEDKVEKEETTKTSGTKSSVQKLVDTGLSQADKLSGQVKQEESKVVVNTSANQNINKPAQTTTTTTKPQTQTTVKTVKPSYNVYKTVSGGGVKVQFAYGNKMIITANGQEKIMDIGQVSKATIKNGNLFVELANGDTRSYSINGSTLNLTKTLTGAVQTITTSGYAYVLKENGTVFLYNTVDGIINPSEIAILKGTSPVSEIISANGKVVTVELTTGKEKSYIYNGSASFDVK